MKKCPFCAEEIQDEAIICRHCGRDLSAPTPVIPPVAPQKKRSSAGLLFILIIVALFVLYALGSANRSDAPSSSAPSAPAASETYRITYRITGSTSAASLTYQNASGDTEQAEVRVPWEQNFGAYPGDFLYISAQNENDSGNITCEILVNGVVVKTTTSRGGYVIATCSGRL